MAKKVKLTDIAAAGVSIATVDRVVNGRGGATADKAAAVLAALMQPPANPFHTLLRDGVEA